MKTYIEKITEYTIVERVHAHGMYHLVRLADGLYYKNHDNNGIYVTSEDGFASHFTDNRTLVEEFLGFLETFFDRNGRRNRTVFAKVFEGLERAETLDEALEAAMNAVKADEYDTHAIDDIERGDDLVRYQFDLTAKSEKVGMAYIDIWAENDGFKCEVLVDEC